MPDERTFTPFEARVHAFVQRVPKGRVATYGDVAAAIGQPGASRAVGNVMRRNPDTSRTPCHRVVRGDGTVGGYMGRGLGGPQKAARLRQEGIRVDADGRIRDFEDVRWP